MKSLKQLEVNLRNMYQSINFARLCRADQVKEFSHTTREYSHTVEHDDDQIFVGNGENAANITTGREGKAALQERNKERGK
jgi:nitrogen regulatory protein PII